MSFDFAKLTYRPKPVAERPADGELPPETVLGLWEKKTAIQATDNIDLVRWHEDNGSAPEDLRRACELNAAADLSLSLGQYVEAVIHPRLTKRRD